MTSYIERSRTTLFSQGNKLLREMKIEEAIQEYYKSIDNLETYFAYENLGFALEKINRIDEAETFYRKAMELSSSAVRASNFFKQNNSLRKKICLVRIIGNELPNLHAENQNLENLNFILNNEKDHESIDKLFILNRIVSKIKNEKYKNLIKQKGYKYLEIEFDPQEYEKVDFFYGDLPKENKTLDEWGNILVEVSKRRLKNKYIMNNNGARNFAIEYGIKNNYDWTLPFDGNCYFSEHKIDEIVVNLNKNNHLDYAIIPMQRVLNNKEVHDKSINEKSTEEPQIGFKKTANIMFSDDRVYGNQSKVELLKVLGVPGKWDEWLYEYPWKKIITRPPLADINYFTAGSVYRLSSGNNDATKKSESRANIRAKAIIEHIDTIDNFLKARKNNNSIVDFYYYTKTKIKERKNYSEKENNFINKVFDKIYLVNLKKQVQERLTAEKHLNEKKIEFETYTAINGYQKQYTDWFKEYSKEPIGVLKHFKNYEYIEKGRSTKLIESPGAVGYIETYIKILKNAKYNNYKRILILEDDVILCDSFETRFKNFIDNIENNWKILLLGASQYGWKSVDHFYALKNGFYYPRIHDTKGSFAIAFDESIYDEVISNQSHMDAPFDHIPLGDLYEKNLGKCFTVFPYLVMPDVSSSTIRGGRVQDEHSNRMKWWLGDFVYPQKKPNVGIFISNSKSIKHSNWLWNKDLPFTLSLLKSDDNGIVPIHDAEQVTNEASKNISINELSNLSLNYDFFYVVENEKTLTQDLIVDKLTGKSTENNKSLVTIKQVNDKFKNHVNGRVTVILPTYKRPDNLRTAAESVLKQCYNDIELIIVDDNGASSKYYQETSNLVRNLKKEYSHRNIIYIQHKVNANGASARNTGIFASSGEYICFLDDDDIYLAGRVTKSIEAIRHTNNNVGAVYCGFLGWNSPKIDLERFAEGSLSKNLLTLDYKSHYLHTNTATYKRSAIFNINGFDPTFKRHQDLEFNLRFFEEYEIRAVRECLVKLAPIKSSIDNKLYGEHMFNLKIKFLKKFKTIIGRLEENIRNDIYEKHWNEIINYAPDIKKSEHTLKEEYFKTLKSL